MKIPNSPFTTHLSGSARETELRLRNIFQWKKKRPPVAALILAALIALSCGSLVSCQPSQEEESVDSNMAPDSGSALLNDAEFSFQDGLVYIKYAGSETWEEWSAPVPAPASWATQDLAGRDEAETLVSCDHWIGLTSSDSGWFVASVGAGVAHADTYVYRTHDGGRTWEEVGRPEEANWYPTCVAFLDDDHAIIGFGTFVNAPIYRTDDGGETWVEITDLPLSDGIWQATSITYEGNTVTMCLQYHDQSHDGPEVALYSEDYGAHWSRVGDDDVTSVDHQIQLIAEHVDDWITFDEYANGCGYAVTDLDGNGRLELIAANIAGTGHNTTAYFYEVDETYTQLVSCTYHVDEGESQADILFCPEAAYYSTATGITYYVFEDFGKIGAAEYPSAMLALWLDGGEVRTWPLAMKYAAYKGDGTLDYISITDWSGAEIDEAAYEAIGDRYFAGQQKQPAVIGWLNMTPGEIRDTDPDTLELLLFDSYQEFSPKETL